MIESQCVSIEYSIPKIKTVKCKQRRRCVELQKFHLVVLSQIVPHIRAGIVHINICVLESPHSQVKSPMYNTTTADNL